MRRHHGTEKIETWTWPTLGLHASFTSCAFINDLMHDCFDWQYWSFHFLDKTNYPKLTQVGDISKLHRRMSHFHRFVWSKECWITKISDQRCSGHDFRSCLETWRANLLIHNNQWAIKPEIKLLLWSGTCESSNCLANDLLYIGATMSYAPRTPNWWCRHFWVATCGTQHLWYLTSQYPHPRIFLRKFRIRLTPVSID